jgi:hypothetical protein
MTDLQTGQPAMKDLDAPPAAPSGEAEIKNAALHHMEPADYIAERKDQEAEDRGENPSEKPEARKARGDRYMRALESARRQEHPTSAVSPTAQAHSDLLNEAARGMELEQAYETIENFEQRVRTQERDATAYNVRMQDYAKRNPDARTDMGVFEYFQPAAHVEQIIMRSEMGPAIAHELAKIPEAVFELNDLPPAEAARVLGVVEGRLRAQEHFSNQQRANPVRVVTRAPAPMTQLSGGASPTPKLDDMDMKQYVQTRRRQNRED